MDSKTPLGPIDHWPQSLRFEVWFPDDASSSGASRAHLTREFCKGRKLDNSGRSIGPGGSRESKMRAVTTIASLGLLALGTTAWAADGWQQQIASGLGKPGTDMPGGVYRVGLPRTDLHVVLMGSRSSRPSPSAHGSRSSRWATMSW
jgi:hypothetical protein